MPTCETAKGLIYYEASAADIPQSPLLLIHGAGGSRLDWPAAVRETTQRPVLALDLPGHGHSPGPGCDSISAYTDVLIAFLDVMNIEKAHLAGHSMGGAIAQQAALTHPARTESLILVATGAKLPVNPHIIAKTAEMIPRMARWMWHPCEKPELLDFSIQQMQATGEQTLRGDYVACDSFDLRQRLPEIKAKTLIFGALMDKMMPISSSEELAAGIPDSQLLRHETAGHMLALEHSEWFCQRLLAWLDESAA